MVSFVAESCVWTPKKLRQSYDLILERFTEWGFEPNIVTMKAPDVPARFGSRYATLIRRRKKIEASSFRNVHWMELTHTTTDKMAPHNGMLLQASLMPNPNWRRLTLSFVPSLTAVPDSEVRRLCVKLVELSGAKYAYRIQNRIWYSLGGYTYGGGYGEVIRPRDESDLTSNSNEWGRSAQKAIETGTLRDIHPRMYLKDSCLDSLVGYSNDTLRVWIENDPNRGILIPFTSSLTEWIPKQAQIHIIRESLFRAGRLFYWRHFDARESLCREQFVNRWEPQGETPDIYLPKFYRGCDPSFTW